MRQRDDGRQAFPKAQDLRYALAVHARRPFGDVVKSSALDISHETEHILPHSTTCESGYQACVVKSFFFVRCCGVGFGFAALGVGEGGGGFAPDEGVC